MSSVGKCEPAAHVLLPSSQVPQEGPPPTSRTLVERLFPLLGASAFKREPSSSDKMGIPPSLACEETWDDVLRYLQQCETFFFRSMLHVSLNTQHLPEGPTSDADSSANGSFGDESCQEASGGVIKLFLMMRDREAPCPVEDSANDQLISGVPKCRPTCFNGNTGATGKTDWRQVKPVCVGHAHAFTEQECQQQMRSWPSVMVQYAYLLQTVERACTTLYQQGRLAYRYSHCVVLGYSGSGSNAAATIPDADEILNRMRAQLRYSQYWWLKGASGEKTAERTEIAIPSLLRTRLFADPDVAPDGGQNGCFFTSAGGESSQQASRLPAMEQLLWRLMQQVGVSSNDDAVKDTTSGASVVHASRDPGTSSARCLPMSGGWSFGSHQTTVPSLRVDLTDNPSGKAIPPHLRQLLHVRTSESNIEGIAGMGSLPFVVGAVRHWETPERDGLHVRIVPASELAASGAILTECITELSEGVSVSGDAKGVPPEARLHFSSLIIEVSGTPTAEETARRDGAVCTGNDERTIWNELLPLCNFVYVYGSRGQIEQTARDVTEALKCNEKQKSPRQYPSRCMVDALGAVGLAEEGSTISRAWDGVKAPRLTFLFTVRECALQWTLKTRSMDSAGGADAALSKRDWIERTIFPLFLHMEDPTCGASWDHLASRATSPAELEISVNRVQHIERKFHFRKVDTPTGIDSKGATTTSALPSLSRDLCQALRYILFRQLYFAPRSTDAASSAGIEPSREDVGLAEACEGNSASEAANASGCTLPAAAVTTHLQPALKEEVTSSSPPLLFGRSDADSKIYYTLGRTVPACSTIAEDVALHLPPAEVADAVVANSDRSAVRAYPLLFDGVANSPIAGSSSMSHQYGVILNRNGSIPSVVPFANWLVWRTRVGETRLPPLTLSPETEFLSVTISVYMKAARGACVRLASEVALGLCLAIIMQDRCMVSPYAPPSPSSSSVGGNGALNATKRHEEATTPPKRDPKDNTRAAAAEDLSPSAEGTELALGHSAVLRQAMSFGRLVLMSVMALVSGPMALGVADPHFISSAGTCLYHPPLPKGERDVWYLQRHRCIVSGERLLASVLPQVVDRILRSLSYSLAAGQLRTFCKPLSHFLDDAIYFRAEGSGTTHVGTHASVRSLKEFTVECMRMLHRYDGTHLLPHVCAENSHAQCHTTAEDPTTQTKFINDGLSFGPLGQRHRSLASACLYPPEYNIGSGVSADDYSQAQSLGVGERAETLTSVSDDILTTEDSDSTMGIGGLPQVHSLPRQQSQSLSRSMQFYVFQLHSLGEGSITSSLGLHSTEVASFASRPLDFSLAASRSPSPNYEDHPLSRIVSQSTSPMHKVASQHSTEFGPHEGRPACTKICENALLVRWAGEAKRVLMALFLSRSVLPRIAALAAKAEVCETFRPQWALEERGEVQVQRLAADMKAGLNAVQDALKQALGVCPAITQQMHTSVVLVDGHCARHHISLSQFNYSEAEPSNSEVINETYRLADMPSIRLEKGVVEGDDASKSSAADGDDLPTSLILASVRRNAHEASLTTHRLVAALMRALERVEAMEGVIPKWFDRPEAPSRARCHHSPPHETQNISGVSRSLKRNCDHSSMDTLSVAFQGSRCSTPPASTLATQAGLEGSSFPSRVYAPFSLASGRVHNSNHMLASKGGDSLAGLCIDSPGLLFTSLKSSPGPTDRRQRLRQEDLSVPCPLGKVTRHTSPPFFSSQSFSVNLSLRSGGGYDTQLVPHYSSNEGLGKTHVHSGNGGLRDSRAFLEAAKKTEGGLECATGCLQRRDTENKTTRQANAVPPFMYFKSFRTAPPLEWSRNSDVRSSGSDRSHIIHSATTCPQSVVHTTVSAHGRSTGTDSSGTPISAFPRTRSSAPDGVPTSNTGGTTARCTGTSSPGPTCAPCLCESSLTNTPSRALRRELDFEGSTAVIMMRTPERNTESAVTALADLQHRLAVATASVETLTQRERLCQMEKMTLAEQLRQALDQLQAHKFLREVCPSSNTADTQPSVVPSVESKCLFSAYEMPVEHTTESMVRNRLRADITELKADLASERFRVQQWRNVVESERCKHAVERGQLEQKLERLSRATSPIFPGTVFSEEVRSLQAERIAELESQVTKAENERDMALRALHDVQKELTSPMGGSEAERHNKHSTIASPGQKLKAVCVLSDATATVGPQQFETEPLHGRVAHLQTGLSAQEELHGGGDEPHPSPGTVLSFSHVNRGGPVDTEELQRRLCDLKKEVSYEKGVAAALRQEKHSLEEALGHVEGSLIELQSAVLQAQQDDHVFTHQMDRVQRRADELQAALGDEQQKNRQQGDLIRMLQEKLAAALTEKQEAQDSVESLKKRLQETMMIEETVKQRNDWLSLRLQEAQQLWTEADTAQREMRMCCLETQQQPARTDEVGRWCTEWMQRCNHIVQGIFTREAAYISQMWDYVLGAFQVALTRYDIEAKYMLPPVEVVVGKDMDAISLCPLDDPLALRYELERRRRESASLNEALRQHAAVRTADSRTIRTLQHIIRAQSEHLGTKSGLGLSVATSNNVAPLCFSTTFAFPRSQSRPSFHNPMRNSDCATPSLPTLLHTSDEGPTEHRFNALHQQHLAGCCSPRRSPLGERKPCPTPHLVQNVVAAPSQQEVTLGRNIETVGNGREDAFLTPVEVVLQRYAAIQDTLKRGK